jgi:apolipoprotein N-acyltransferase
MIGGLSFYFAGIYWISLYLGPAPLIALALLEAIIFSAGCLAMVIVWRFLESRLGHRRLWLQATALASVWSAREWVSTHLPYGGFPWLRVSQALADSPLNKWAWFGGLAWLTFVGSFLGILGALAWLHRKDFGRPQWVFAGVIAAVLIAFPLVIHPSNSAEAGTIRVAAVQGNAKAGLFANEQWGSILENHLRQTRALMKTAQGSRAQLVVWPENASDISPIDYPQAASKISALVDEINKPLILGTTRQHGKRIYNSSILWLPGSKLAAVYDKKRPVPFAEYVPDRPFWHGIAPTLIDLIQRGFAPGHRSGIFKVAGTSAGVLICFEIAIDDISRDLVDQGAQLIISQTNNADFGHSAETYQQAQLAKLQAIATGRAVVNISTVGISEVILPDGSIAAEVPVFKAASLVANVPLRTSATPAQTLSVYLELAINLFAATMCLLALLRLTRKN